VICGTLLIVVAGHDHGGANPDEDATAATVMELHVQRAALIVDDGGRILLHGLSADDGSAECAPPHPDLLGANRHDDQDLKKHGDAEEETDEEEHEGYESGLDDEEEFDEPKSELQRENVETSYEEYDMVDRDESDIEADDEEEYDEESYGEHDYATMTVSEMWTHAFQCDEVFRRGDRPIHGEATWAFLRGVYLGVSSHRADGAATAAPASPPLGTGFRKAVSARQTPDGKGRGVFAAEPIRSGELVWSATFATARFSTGPAYRQFLSLLPPDLACDVLQWAYVQEVTTEAYTNIDPACSASSAAVGPSPNETQPAECGKRELRVSVDLDEGSYMNSEDDDPNVGCLVDDEERMTGKGLSCQHHFFALRDIRVGEELLCSYGAFAWSDGWSEFGL
jgi:hypothetical protein